jgi:multiple sugar transport system permease protein
MPRKLAGMIDGCVHYALLTIAATVVLLPVAWAISTSLKPASAAMSFPPVWIPTRVTFENYTGVVASGFGRYFVNSLIVTCGTILLCLFVAAHCAYATTRFAFRGKTTLLFAILASGMVPAIAILVPLYLLAVTLPIVDTYFVLTLVYASWLTPLTTWTLRGFFERVPTEIEEAALVDGCSRLRAFYTIVMPLTLPGFAAAGVYIFLETWNEFLIAVSLTSTADRRLLTVGLYQYVTSFGVEWGLLTAAALVALLPVLVPFLGMQKLFVSGLTAGAVKE